jgi:deltex-like protein
MSYPLIAARYQYVAPEHLNDSNDDASSASELITKIGLPIIYKTKRADCAICLESLQSVDELLQQQGTKNGNNEDEIVKDWQPCFQLQECGHVFHNLCLVQSLQTSLICPMCRVPVTSASSPQGTSPSGTLSVRRISTPCPGFAATTSSTSSLELVYELLDGIQKVYHDHPGQPFRGNQRWAYLPDNPEGNDLLQRLVYAFQHGLTFRVGTSLTTGRTNQVVWASIHHKTSLQGGSFGFPDPTYLDRCHDELDALRVPRN